MAGSKTFNLRDHPLAKSQANFQSNKSSRHRRHGNNREGYGNGVAVQFKKYGSNDGQKRSKKPRIVVKKFIETTGDVKQGNSPKSKHKQRLALAKQYV